MSELEIDSNDLYIHLVHRLGTLYKAKQRQLNDNPRRPIIIAFQDFTMMVMEAAYKLQGSGHSVTRDYTEEIVAARQRLLPRLRLESQNRNKVTNEYPEKLVVNERVVADEFPDS